MQQFTSNQNTNVTREDEIYCLALNRNSILRVLISAHIDNNNCIRVHSHFYNRLKEIIFNEHVGWKKVLLGKS
jgi:hypothetical protein